MSINEPGLFDFEDNDSQLPDGRFSAGLLDDFQISTGFGFNMELPGSTSFDVDSIFPQLEPHSALPIARPGENGISPSLQAHSTVTVQPSQSSKFQGKPPRRSLDSANTLRQWMRHHSDNPYPTKTEKASLAQQSGLTVSQVSTWFANARRRHKDSPSIHSSSLVPKPVDSVNEFQLPTHDELSSMSPLDRWRNSPPEIEPAPLEAIASAVAHNTVNEVPDGRPDQIASSSGGRRKSLSSAGNGNESVVSSQASGSGLSNSSGSSAYSFGSNRSGGSFGCFYLGGPPQRRRRHRSKRKPLKTKTPVAATDKHKRPFQCTFCTDTFRTKYDWTRHEKTLHLSLEKFTCAPFGSVYSDPIDGTNRCVFCDEPRPSESHVETHRFSTCQQKPLGFRTFYRKDHLVQHLRLMHGVSRLMPSMDSWKSQVKQINSRCGFCDDRFTVWSERNDHIARHFRNGALMKSWKGCRGLDPPVALAVENAMPPYLIGMESDGLNPFSASRTMDRGGGPGNDAEIPEHPTRKAKPTPFEYLTAQLGEFVKKTGAAGQTVTDEMLQKEARCIVYCDDDPWNQTPADNPEWLTLFKEGMGLGSASDPFQADNPNSDSDLFCLPWTAGQWSPLASNTGCVAQDSLDMNGTCTAWSWQSPECLVEFRRHLAASSAEKEGQCVPGSERPSSTAHNAPLSYLDGVLSIDQEPTNSCKLGT